MTITNPVLDAIERRRATRAFTSEPVTEEQIRTLLHAAVLAPTAMHEEPWAFVVVQDPAMLKRISDRAKALLVERHVSDQLPPPLRAVVTDPSFSIFYTARTLIVICARKTGPFVAPDCWLAAENLMLAATSLGLATCPIGFALAALEDKELAAELGIPPGGVAVAPIIVGVASAPVPARTRREPAILSWKK